ncbi:MAG: anti-sigma factor RsiW [Saprospiraceae bacterium]|jgi:anti-sigma factor RsiW
MVPNRDTDMENKKIICMELENKLIDYLDDALTATQRAEVEKQLEKSAELRQTLDELKMVMNGMETSEEFQPSLNLKNNFDQFLQKEINNQGGEDVNIVAFKKPNSG